MHEDVGASLRMLRNTTPAPQRTILELLLMDHASNREQQVVCFGLRTSGYHFGCHGANVVAITQNLNPKP